MVHPPEHFTTAFAPGDNSFGITIHKIFPPPDVDPRYRKAILIKVTVLLRMGPEMELKEFRALVAAIAAAKLFCGIWSAEISPAILDDEGATSEVLCYLQQGQEPKLVHLDRVVQASPSFRRPAAFDRKADEADLVEDFIASVRTGSDLETAVRGAVQKSKDRGTFVSGETEPRYVIGKGGGKVVVVEGNVAKRLLEADADRQVPAKARPAKRKR